MAAHTPGPWVAEPTPPNVYNDVDATETPFWIVDAATGEVLATFHNTANDDEAFANASVCAKAPDLLASCQELRAVLLAALDVIAITVGIEGRDRIAEDLARRGFSPGIIGVRADGVIAEAEGRPKPTALLEPDSELRDGP